MSCPWLERLSMELDGELSPPESADVRRHLASCAECAAAMDDFEAIRRELQAYPMLDSDHDDASMKNMSGSKRFVRRRLELPLPVAAAAAIVIGLLAAALWFRPATVSAPAPAASPPIARGERVAEDPGLAAFDHGGRAAVYKTSRRASTPKEGGTDAHP